jgi:hypothetical protein
MCIIHHYSVKVWKIAMTENNNIFKEKNLLVCSTDNNLSKKRYIYEQEGHDSLDRSLEILC